MRVLHLAPLWFPVAADASGGIEIFLAGLIEALERLGCRNTLIASGDSDVGAPVVPVVTDNLFGQMSAGRALEYAYYEQEQLMLALERAADFDLVHSHIGPGGLVLSDVPGLLALHTWHTQVYRDLPWLVRRRPDIRFSTVSDFQAARLREHGAIHCHVIHHGVDLGSFPFGPEPSQRLLFIGRLDATKGADLAIAAARTLGWPLTLAGPITDRVFFERTIEPLLDDVVRYVGIASHREKRELFRQAGCVLVPSRVEEAGPLVAIEALACGTPVVGSGQRRRPGAGRGRCDGILDGRTRHDCPTWSVARCSSIARECGPGRPSGSTSPTWHDDTGTSTASWPAPASSRASGGRSVRAR